jgi:integrase
MKKHLKDLANEKTHMVTTTDFEGIQEIMWKLCTHLATSTRMSWQVRVASLALPLTHLRPGELVALRWSEIDFKKGLINIPGAYKAHTEKPEKRMKMSRDHIIPMSKQLKDLLKQTKELSKRQGIVSRYVFPKIIARKNMLVDQDGKCHIDETISIEALEDTLTRAGISSKTELTPHGWRAMASTSLNGGLTLNDEKKRFESKWIEVALSHHSIKNEDGGAMAQAYNHAKYLPERKEMIQDWANFLEGFIMTNPALKSLHQPNLALLAQPMQMLSRIA